MNLLDMLMIAVLSFCAIRGIFRGLVSELFAIIGVLSGFYAAYTYYPEAAKPLAAITCLAAAMMATVRNSPKTCFLEAFLGNFMF